MSANTAPIPISRSTAAEAIIDLLLERKLALEERVNEVTICQLLGLESDRQIVREALAILARGGIVQQKPGEGTYIRNISLVEARNAHLQRAEILASISTQLASNYRPIRVELAEAALVGMEMSTIQGSTIFMKAESLFYSELARGGGFLNASLAMRGWSYELQVYRLHSPISLRKMSELVTLHHKLLNRIRSQNSDGSVAVVFELVEVLNREEDGAI